MMEEKENYKVIRNASEFMKRIPLTEPDRALIRRNTEFLFKEITKPREIDGKKGTMYYIKIFCPICERNDFMFQIVFDHGPFKEEFDKDEPLKIMCQKCQEGSQFLVASGVTDPEIIKGVLRDMAKESMVAG